MSKGIAVVTLALLQLFISYFIFTVAWGLTVQSWPALVLGLFATMLVSFTMAVVGSE